MSGPDFSRVLISLHIPKTGGQTFMRALETLTPHGFIPDYENRPLAPEPIPRRIKQHRLDMARMGLVMERLRDTEGPVIVHGHFFSGKYRSVFPEARYLCWLREPIERLCSHHAYWKRTSKLLRGMDDSEKPGLEEFALSKSRRNVQSRFLCSTRLDAFDFIGITGQFDRSLRLFQAVLGVEIPDIPTENRNPKHRFSETDLDTGVRARIEELNAQDMALYPRALARFSALCDTHGV